MKKVRVYISGPMSGLSKECVVSRFSLAEAYLREHGVKHVSNPIRFLPFRYDIIYRLLGYDITLLYDLFWLSRCTHIFMLHGWEESRGARTEFDKAWRSGLKVLCFNDYKR